MKTITEKAITKFNRIVDHIEARCMAMDGPVSATLQEANESELSDLWKCIQEIRDRVPDEWVDVSERLPGYNIGVLVFIPGEDNHVTSGMWDISKKWVLLDEYRVPDQEVTHWMPLVEPPKI